MGGLGKNSDGDKLTRMTLGENSMRIKRNLEERSVFIPQTSHQLERMKLISYINDSLDLF